MQQTLDILHQRARLFRQIRAFFDACGYLEVETPLLNKSTNTDVHIQSIAAQVCGVTQYLQTSPEFSMKRLLSAGSGSIYQICHAFRDEEHGRFHRAEFTLLEWYSVGFNYQMLMDQLQQLIEEIFPDPQSFKRIRYFDAFQVYLGVNPEVINQDELFQVVLQHIPGCQDLLLSRDDCLDLLISQVIVKQFEGFTFVYDYPASQASLARLKIDKPEIAERFELFYNETELANGFTELTHAGEQRFRFLKDNEYRAKIGLPQYPLDEEFLQSLETGIPDCAGVAVGLDRLLMALLGVDDIQMVLSI